MSIMISFCSVTVSHDRHRVLDTVTPSKSSQKKFNPNVRIRSSSRSSAAVAPCPPVVVSCGKLALSLPASASAHLLTGAIGLTLLASGSSTAAFALLSFAAKDLALRSDSLRRRNMLRPMNCVLDFVSVLAVTESALSNVPLAGAGFSRDGSELKR